MHYWIFLVLWCVRIISWPNLDKTRELIIFLIYICNLSIYQLSYNEIEIPTFLGYLSFSILSLSLLVFFNELCQ